MKTRKRPAPGKGRPIPNNTSTGYLTAPWHHDPREPLTAEDRADLAVLEAAAQRGFRLATRCIRCGQWLVAPTSVRAHLGPVCRTRGVAE